MSIPLDPLTVSGSNVVSNMYTIGEFAAHGRVSVRMLRHYDAIGLLEPAHVDPQSGYRFYEPAQLGALLRIVELRDLGCSLDDAALVAGADDEEAAMRAALVRRRAELEASVAADSARIARIDARLSPFEGAPAMTDVTYTRIPAVTVYAASGIAAEGGPEHVSPVVDRILPPLLEALESSGVDFREPGVFWYEPVDDSGALRVWVSWVAGDEPVENDAWEVVELPAIERAAVTDYRGDMPGIGQAWHDFMQAIVDDGSEMYGACREVYLEADGPQSEWLTQLQQAVR